MRRADPGSSMEILVPIDGSDCSERALRFAAGMARRYEAEVHVVHFSEHATEQTEELLREAEAVLEEEGVTGDSAVISDVRLSDVRYSDRVGEDVLRLVEEHDYDHVVMGHHGTGMVGRLILGSAAETVVQSTEVPVTIIP